MTTWAANTRLGTVRLVRGDIDGAQLAFEAALEADAEHAEATLGLMECWLESGDGARILEPLMPYMEANIADAWMLAAAACEEMGRLEDALLFVGRAHELQENGLQASMHRNLRMLELLSMAGLYTGKPLSGPGSWGALGAIVSRQPLPAIAKPGPVDGPKTVRLVTHCVTAGWADMIESMLEPRAEQVAPGIGDVVRRTLQALGAESIDSDVDCPVFVGGTWDAGVRSLQGLSMRTAAWRLEKRASSSPSSARFETSGGLVWPEISRPQVSVSSSSTMRYVASSRVSWVKKANLSRCDTSNSHTAHPSPSRDDGQDVSPLTLHPRRPGRPRCRIESPGTRLD